MVAIGTADGEDDLRNEYPGTSADKVVLSLIFNGIKACRGVVQVDAVMVAALLLLGRQGDVLARRRQVTCRLEHGRQGVRQ